MEELLEQYFIFIFLLMWVTLSYYLSKISGWSTLSEQYKNTGNIEGERWWFKSASIGKNSSKGGMVNQLFKQARYGNMLMLLSNQTGLRVSVIFPFRIGHPPLFIPWKDIEITEEKRLFWCVLRFNVSKSNVSLFFDKRLGEKLKTSRGIS